MNILLSTSLVLGLAASIFFYTEKTGKLVDESKVTYNINENKKLEGAFKIEDAANVLRLRGSYIADKRSGDWYCFDAKGKMVLRYNYTVGKLLSLEQGDLTTLDIKVLDKNTEVANNASIPIPICSIDQYKTILIEELKDQLPGKEKAGIIDVTAEIIAMIDGNGSAKYVALYAVNGVENKVVIYLKDKLFDLEWLPAKYNGKTYKSEVKFSTSFQIDPSTSSSKRFVWNY